MQTETDEDAGRRFFQQENEDPFFSPENRILAANKRKEEMDQ